MRFQLPELHRDPASFDALARLHAQTKELIFDDIEDRHERNTLV